MRGGRILVAALFLAAAPVRADEAKRVWVVPLEAFGATEGTNVAAAAQDLLEEAVAGVRGLALLERERVRTLLEEQGVSASLGRDQAVRLGRLLPAEYAVTGLVARAPSGWRFTLEVLHLPDGRVLAAIDTTGAGGDLGATAARAAKEVAQVLGRATPASSVREGEAAGASSHYLRGLGFHLAGLHAEAIGELLEARRRTVRFAETGFWMGEAYLEAGLPDHAVIAFDDYLARSPASPLAARARADLERARASAAKPEPRRPPTLSEVLLSESGGPEREAAVERAIARGAEGVADLEAAVDVCDDARLLERILDALATIDVDAFLAVVASDRSGNLLRAGRAWMHVRDGLTPARAGRLTQALHARHSALRDRGAQLCGFLLHADLHPEARVALVAGILNAAAERDPDTSIVAIRLLPDDPTVLELVGRRLTDEAFTASYRAEALGAVERRAWTVPAICDALVTLMGDERPVLRTAALRATLSGGDAWSAARSEDERARLARLPERFAARALELLTSRRFPEDALEFAMRTRGSFDDRLAQDLLASDHPRERAAALHLLRTRKRAAPASLDDPDEIVRTEAILGLGNGTDPAQAFRDLLAWWRRRLAAPDRPLRISERLALEATLLNLGWRVRSPRPAPPSRDEGPDAWEGWFAREGDR